MNPTALFECLSSSSCIVTQLGTGLIVGSLLFLVAAGLTLIFGVLGVVNFAHGSFYMLGAYVALTAYRVSGSFTIAVLAAGLGVGLFGLLFERFLMRRVYNADVLMQLLVCYAIVLIMDDVVKIVWGAEFQSMGMPDAFQSPPLFIAGGVIPVFYVYLIAAAMGIALVLWAILTHTRIENPGARIDVMIREVGGEVWACEVDDAWTGVIFPAFGQGADNCRAAERLASPREYQGPCRWGWVETAVIAAAAG